MDHLNIYFQSISGNAITNSNSLLVVNGEATVNLIGELMTTTGEYDNTANIINLTSGTINLNINQITSSGICINLPIDSVTNLNAYVGGLSSSFTGARVKWTYYLTSCWYKHPLQFNAINIQFANEIVNMTSEQYDLSRI